MRKNDILHKDGAKLRAIIEKELASSGSWDWDVRKKEKNEKGKINSTSRVWETVSHNGCVGRMGNQLKKKERANFTWKIVSLPWKYGLLRQYSNGNILLKTENIWVLS